MQLPYKELRVFIKLTKSCVFPRSRKECRNISLNTLLKKFFWSVTRRSHVLWETPGEWKSFGPGARASGLALCSAVWLCGVLSG